jgi:uncharacterized protein DUF1344
MEHVKGAVALLVTLAVAAPIGWAGETLAQTMDRPAQGTPGAEKRMEVEGRIMNVHPSGGMVTLDDGTLLTIPPTVGIQRGALKEGATVKASYEERNGQKVVTSIEVRP